MGIYTLRSGAIAHPEDSVLQFVTDLISSSGVVNLTANHFKVEAQATPDMTVKVNPGNAYVKGASTNAYPVRMDLSQNSTISPNASGNSRIDAVVLYIDKSATPDATASNIAKFIVVAGTPAPSPAAPLDSDIQTAVGASNPFLRLAEVTVASGATSIVNGNITDKRVQFAVSLPTLNSPTINSPIIDSPTIKTKFAASGFYDNGNSGTSKSINWTNGDRQKVALTGNCTFTFSGAVAGQILTLELIQDGTGGRTITLPTIKWSGGSAPTFSTGANAIDTISVMYDGTNYIGQTGTGYA